MLRSKKPKPDYALIARLELDLFTKEQEEHPYGINPEGLVTEVRVEMEREWRTTGWGWMPPLVEREQIALEEAQRRWPELMSGSPNASGQRGDLGDSALVVQLKRDAIAAVRACAKAKGAAPSACDYEQWRGSDPSRGPEAVTICFVLGDWASALLRGGLIAEHNEKRPQAGM